MAPRQRDPSPEHAPGILSNVFGFVARELESFVTTAVGGSEVKTEERARSRPSSSRVKLDDDADAPNKKKRRRESAQRRVRPEVESDEDVGPCPRSLHSGVDLDPETPRAGRPRKKTTRRSTPSPASGYSKAADPFEGDAPRTRARSSNRTRGHTRSEAESEDNMHANTGTSRRQSCRHIDSDSENSRGRRARKKTPSRGVSPSPTPARSRVAETSRSREYTVPVNGTPGSRSPSPTQPPLPALLKPKEIVTMPGSLFPRSESLIPDSPPTPVTEERRVGWLPRTPSPTPPTPKPIEKTPQRTEKSEKAKGKERARDSPGEARMRGKERELRAAREAHARNELARDDEERERDRRRIKMLEGEIARLRAQLAARNDTFTHMHPPPPPAPPPPSAKLFKAPITPTVARANSFLASARANLKPTTPPIEAPINSAAGKTRRTGHPTVNVPSDKMAAFLNEMKTVRLRKTSTGESDSRSMPPPRYIPGERSFSAVENSIGEKRKRDAFFAGDMEPGPSKKRNTTFIVPSANTGSSTSSQSSQSSSLSFPPPDHAPPRGWPSVATTETDITTPSLCSDNENEHEQDADERLPPTPPHDRTQHSVSTRSEEQKLSVPREIIDVDAEFPEPAGIAQPQPRAARLETEKTPPFVDFFARRPPNSPMPPTPVRRLLPPGRKRPKPPPAPVITGDVSDGDDPLAMSLPDLGRPGSTPHPVREKRPAQKLRSRTSSTASRDTSGSARDVPKSQDAASNRARRRRTLDDELRRTGDKLWDPDALSDDELAGGVDSGELVGLGTKSKKKGFLKGGGGGGKPVFMGVGYVQGAEDDGDDEDEDNFPPPVSRRRKATKSKERVE